MLGIVKVYPDGTVALRGVDFRARPGEIHALLGENGAGKTTLMRILYGEIRPTRGEIRVFGEKVSFRSPRDALKRGIAMVYQHFSLVPTFTAFENIYMAVGSISRVSRRELRIEVEELMRELGLKVPLDEVVEKLPVGIQQRVELLKALALKAKILILDEPTSVLSPAEAEGLFRLLKRLRDEGHTVIYITHKLREVHELADTVTVMRRGKVVASSLDARSVDEATLARLMVGEEIVTQAYPLSRRVGPPVLVIRDLWVRGDRGEWRVRGVSLEVRRGEILGIAGVQGSGQNELAEAIVGLRKPEKGTILLDGVDITRLSVEDRYRLGIAYIIDSRSVGLVQDMSVVDNSILTWLWRFVRRGMIDYSEAASHAKRIVEKYNVVTPSLWSRVRYLSGGNQQKLLVGREAEKQPKLLIAAEPTHGLDVRAARFVRETLVKLRDEGIAVLLISSDLDEVLSVSDRIAVMHEGRIIAVEPRNEMSREKIGLLMGGAA
ncbi:ABC transporter ATP-binding protein [Pyrolobus fumarii]